MKIREIEYWFRRKCNECNSETNVKEIVIGDKMQHGGMVTVIALCQQCRDDLYKILLEEMKN